MEKILWIGRCTDSLRERIGAYGELVEAGDVDEGLRSIAGMAVAVAVIPLAGQQAESVSSAIRRFGLERPEVRVLAATWQRVPAAVAAALGAGARDLLDVSGEAAGFEGQVKKAFEAHRRAASERALLLRLRGLNEGFLKNVVALEKRNLEMAGTQQAENSRITAEAVGLLDESGPREKVLVVDDEEMICDVVKLTLEPKGYEITVAMDVASALAAIDRNRYPLVITDKNLPGMTGLDLIRAVKERNPETDVIMMTGYASKDSAIDALNLGASAFLEKPFELPALVERVESVMEAQRGRIKKRYYLALIKERNREFLDEYAGIRAELEAWLETHGLVVPSRNGE